MIFITVGTQLPFERLIKTMDQWAEIHPDIDVFAQIGRTQFPAKHIKTCEGLNPDEYQRYFDKASVVVSHVGMGTIISGLNQAKPMVLMPRLAELGEHRNNHQLSTARKFERFDLIDIANNTQQLYTQLNARLSSQKNYNKVNLTVSDTLEKRLQCFLNNVKAGKQAC